MGSEAGEDLGLHKARVDCGSEEEVGSRGGARQGSVSHILLCLQKEHAIVLIIPHICVPIAFPAIISLGILTVALGKRRGLCLSPGYWHPEKAGNFATKGAGVWPQALRLLAQDCFLCSHES